MNSIVSKELGAARCQLARESFAKIINQEFKIYLLEESREVRSDDIETKMEKDLSHGYGYKCLWKGKRTAIEGAFRKEAEDERVCVWIMIIRDGQLINNPFTPFPLDDVVSPERKR